MRGRVGGGGGGGGGEGGIRLLFRPQKTIKKSRLDSRVNRDIREVKNRVYGKREIRVDVFSKKRVHG